MGIWSIYLLPYNYDPTSKVSDSRISEFAKDGTEIHLRHSFIVILFEMLRPFTVKEIATSLIHPGPPLALYLLVTMVSLPQTSAFQSQVNAVNSKSIKKPENIGTQPKIIFNTQQLSVISVNLTD